MTPPRYASSETKAQTWSLGIFPTGKQAGRAYSGSVQVFHVAEPCNPFFNTPKNTECSRFKDMLQSVLVPVKSPVFMDSNYTKSTLRDLPSEVSALGFSFGGGYTDIFQNKHLLMDHITTRKKTEKKCP